MGGGAACTASYGSEKYVRAVCTDDLGGNEADAYADGTLNWIASGATLDSIDTVPKTGTYHLSMVATGSSHYAYRALPTLTGGTVYRLTFWARHNGTAANDGTWKCWLGAAAGQTEQPLTPTITKTDTTYTQYTKYFVYNTRQDTITCMEGNTDNDGGIYLDAISVKTATLCLGPELHTDANAASVTAEANSVGSWTTAGTSTFESSSTSPDNGTYALHMVANADGGRFYMDAATMFTGSEPTVGKKYLITWKHKYTTGAVARCGFHASSTLGTPTDIVAVGTADTAWTAVGVSIVYNATNHAYFGCKEDGANNTEMYFDSLSIKEITGE